MLLGPLDYKTVLDGIWIEETNTVRSLDLIKQ